ncbi:MAG: hypothetical protein HYU64_00675 [Armatimonadetes bacterium]|nr:hypothetical protein [Armatimonadota bacterium]
MKRLKEGKGGHFDPEIVDAFFRAYENESIDKAINEIAEKGSFMKETFGIYRS